MGKKTKKKLNKGKNKKNSFLLGGTFWGRGKYDQIAIFMTPDIYQ